MSQEQRPRRPQPEPIKYGDILPVSGELVDKPVAMKDAAAMQAEETRVLGETQKGGAAAIMHSAAVLNEKRGVVPHDQMTDVVRDRGVAVTEEAADHDGAPIVTEEVGGEVVAQFAHPGKGKSDTAVEFSPEASAITIGKALEAAALSAGNKPVDESDAAAIQAAEVRATGLEHIVAGGVAAQARSAAAHNAKAMTDEQKTNLVDILKDASRRLQNDKVVTREDAEKVIGAELRNKATVSTYPGGVGEAMAEAARVNQLKLQT